MRTALAFSAALLVAVAVTGGTPSTAEAATVLKSPSDRMLNPQPLPPRWKYRPYRERWILQVLKHRPNHSGLNPQPLPPEPPRQLMVR